MSSWVMDYIGRRYRDDFNCAHMVIDALNSVFGKNIEIGAIPAADENDQIKRQALESRRNHLIKTDEPTEGDVALITIMGSLSHVGIVFLDGTKMMILHGLDKKRGFVVTAPRNLKFLGMKVEGYYKVI